MSDRFNIEDCLSFVDNDQKHGLHGHVKIELEHPETKEKTLWYEDDNIIPISGYPKYNLGCLNI